MELVAILSNGEAEDVSLNFGIFMGASKAESAISGTEPALEFSSLNNLNANKILYRNSLDESLD